MEKFNCERCEDTGEIVVSIYSVRGETRKDLIICPDCCEHFEHDHGYCLDCGEDCLDVLVGRAESYYEIDR